MRPADMFAYEKRPGRALAAVLEGLREVRHRPDLVVLLVVVFFVSTFGINFFMTLAITARSVFGRGAESYGLLTSALAVGCLAGTFVAARRVGRPRLRTVLLAGLFFGVAELFTGVMPTYLLTAVLLIPTGLGQLVFTTAANAAVQLGVAENMRGRVMGLYMLVLLGGTPLGGPVLGWLAEVLGGRAPLVIGGVATVATVVVAAGLLAWQARRTAHSAAA
jgi:MFS family permease